MGQKVSIREFSRQVGVSDVAVGKAIRAGKITNASIDYSNPKRPKIDVESALAEWGKNYDPSYERDTPIRETIVVKPKENGPEKKAPKKLETVATTGPTPEPIQIEQPAHGGSNSYAEIKRQTAKIKLADAALDLKKKQGTLVEKDKVYKALFSMGQEVRSGAQSIPDRVIDDILSARTRNDAHQVLVVAVDEFLISLSEIVNRDINI